MMIGQSPGVALGLQRPSPENGPAPNESHVPPRGPLLGRPEGEYEWKLGHHRPPENPALDTDTLMEAPATGPGRVNATG